MLIRQWKWKVNKHFLLWSPSSGQGARLFHKVDVFGCVAMVMAKLNWQQIINQLNFLHKLIFLHLKRDIIGCLRFSALTNQSLWFSTFKFLVLHMTIFGCLIFLLRLVYYLPITSDEAKFPWKRDPKTSSPWDEILMACLSTNFHQNFRFQEKVVFFAPFLLNFLQLLLKFLAIFA